MATFNCTVSNESPVWGIIHLSIWKGVPERLGGGRPFIQEFKDAWVRHNRSTIKLNATEFKMPAELLAGVCWIEVGGDPNFIDRIAFEVRTFARSASKGKIAMTNDPARTSFGAVSIQLRTAAETLGLKPSEMTTDEFRELSNCLQKDVYNIEVAARHLRQIIDHDKLQKNSPFLTLDQVRVAGARYNRGLGLSLEAIKKNTSYGDFIVRFWPRFTALLNH